MFAHRRHGGLVMVLLSVAMLLVGGGFGPPLLGTILAVPASKINAPLTWWRARLSDGARRALAALWPWLLAIALTAWLLLFPGTNIAAYYYGVDDAGLVAAIILAAFGTLFLTILTALARDAERVQRSPVAFDGWPR